MSVAQQAPSPFAALLRRSKFASYDPSIGQVYTTHGGHAHRGNWGLKRPLPNRRRTGFITVRSVDSPEQQTEWSSAENSARWMRRWEELGKKLEPMELGLWHSKTNNASWTIDTEFSREGKQELRPRRGNMAGKEELEPEHEVAKATEFTDDRSTVPNPDSMTPKQFQKYLEHIRTLRPEFKAFLKEYHAERQAKQQAKQGRRLASEKIPLKFTGSGEVNTFLSAQSPPEAYVTEFLKRRAKKDFYTPESKKIEQRPHLHAGLEYTYMSALQSQYLHKPAPGRDIGQNRASRYQGSYPHQKYDLIAVGGIIGALPEGKHTMVPTDFGTREDPRTDREQGKGLFRMSKVVLQNAPATVGRLPQTVDHAELREIQFRTIQSAMANRSNPHPLGSAAYVAEEGITQGKGRHPVPRKVVNMVQHRVRPPRPPRPEGGQSESEALLGKLGGMINPIKHN